MDDLNLNLLEKYKNKYIAKIIKSSPFPSKTLSHIYC